ncbi:hypothetical protein [Pedosphaera parvula]|uniref:Uncharacterized protein n=1 Tax=Pedosphaera parvula (strain Ellin514) TaxID=320771 RepID=B9XCV1_PEDPL|nr:hypothetical protein [Pedosphaera parvula]EEF62297.1 hypothetical protein Cflav_PD4932 [Pedosphaera parvula Ellin514]
MSKVLTYEAPQNFCTAAVAPLVQGKITPPLHTAINYFCLCGNPLPASFAINEFLLSPDKSDIQNGMKSLTEHLWFEVPNRRGFINLTDTVEVLGRKSGVQ